MLVYFDIVLEESLLSRQRLRKYLGSPYSVCRKADYSMTHYRYEGRP